MTNLLLKEDDIYTNDIFRVACKLIIEKSEYIQHFAEIDKTFKELLKNKNAQYHHLIKKYMPVSQKFYQKYGNTVFVEKTPISVIKNPKLVIKNWNVNRFEGQPEPYEDAIRQCSYVKEIIENMKNFAMENKFFED